MNIQYDKAAPEDYGELIDTANYVFSYAHAPHDFPSLLPKLYRPEYFMDGIHYTAREDGKIRAIVGAYPLAFEFPGVTLPGRGIGMVSVHPCCRSQGYMKTLMNMALEDMKRDGAAFSCLGGQRQRYEYFGFTPVGTVCSFICSRSNVNHTLGRQWKSDLSLKALSPDDTALLDQIQRLHQSKPVRILRRRDRLFETLSSWKAQTFAVCQGERFQGYLICADKNNHISEINLYDPARLPEVIGLFLRERQTADRGDDVEVNAGPHEREKLAVLSRFAEGYTQSPAYHFAVFDYPLFIKPFLALKAREQALAEGRFTLQIEGGPRFCFTVSEGAASVDETNDAPDLSLGALAALHFLFSPLTGYSSRTIMERPFLQSLLPLPLFFENCDGV
jgi:predicted N-acetyltransferase YhbS